MFIHCLYFVHMNTALLTVRTDPTLKKTATKLAGSLGFTLSGLVNAYLRQFVKTKTVHFEENYEPTPYLKRAIKQAEKDRLAGKGSPVFDNAKDAIAWLHRTR